MALRMLATTLCLAGICGAALQAQRPSARRPVTHTVTIDGARFSPADLEVKAGDTVVWVNKDILAHTATSPNGGFDSKVIEPDKSWKFVARKKGSFDYTCSFHPMNGRITVR
jgi:plastocyanin